MTALNVIGKIVNTIRGLLLMIMVLVATPSGALADPLGPSLFGINLGGLLSDMPVCVFHEHTLNFFGEDLCVVIEPDGSTKKISHTNWGADVYKINLPPVKPAWLAPYPYIHVVDGKIVEIQAGTYGNQYQDTVLAALRAKFGKPTSIGSDIAQNAFGARFKRLNATWQLPGATLTLWGTDESVDSGEIRLSTVGYVKLLNDYKKAREANGVKP